MAQPPSPSEELHVQEDLEIFEGASLGNKKRSHRLSSEDIDSLESGDGAYTEERRRKRPSNLSQILIAGSFRSSLEGGLEQQHDDDDDDKLMNPQQQETNKLVQEEHEDTSQRPSIIQKTSKQIIMDHKRRRISWNEVVRVHLHEMILGYNLGVSNGPPVELSWTKFLDEESILHEKFSKTMKELKIPSGVRFRLCRESGADAVQIMSRIEAVDIMRQQLVASVKHAKMEDRKALKQAKKASAKNRRGNNGSSSEQEDGKGCCIIQ